MGEIGPARSELRRVFVQRTVIGAAVLSGAACQVCLSILVNGNGWPPHSASISTMCRAKSRIR